MLAFNGVWSVVKKTVINFYYRFAVCRKYGHLWLPVVGMLQCERIYTSSKLDQHYCCLFCQKTIDLWEYIDKYDPVVAALRRL